MINKMAGLNLKSTPRKGAYTNCHKQLCQREGVSGHFPSLRRASPTCCDCGAAHIEGQRPPAHFQRLQRIQSFSPTPTPDRLTNRGFRHDAHAPKWKIPRKGVHSPKGSEAMKNAFGPKKKCTHGKSITVCITGTSALTPPGAPERFGPQLCISTPSPV